MYHADEIIHLVRTMSNRQLVQNGSSIAITLERTMQGTNDPCSWISWCHAVWLMGVYERELHTRGIYSYT